MAVRWITAFIDHPAAAGGDVVRFWQLVTGSALSTRRGDRGQFATLIPPNGDPHLRVQETDDGSSGIHIDLHVEDVEATTDAATALGAKVVDRPGPTLSLLRSPAGMGFCLVQWFGETNRPAPIWAPSGSPAAGASSALDQVSIDIPHDRFDEECDFWSALTDWPVHRGSVPEFRLLPNPDPMAMRLLLHRLGREDTDTEARAHLDLSSGGDSGVLAAWHTTIGATLVGRGPRWITLTDPGGLPYCLTQRDQVTGQL